MQISSRFTMAIHMFTCIDTFSDQKMTMKQKKHAEKKKNRIQELPEK